jgi:hypothetical protein
MAARKILVYVDVSPGGQAYGADGVQLTQTSAPFIFFREQVQLTVQYISGPPNAVPPTNIYTGFSGSSISSSCCIDNDWAHFYPGTLAASLSAGAITSIQVAGLTAAQVRATSGSIQLINSAGAYETVAYSGYSLSAGVYTFSVSATLSNSYGINATANLLKSEIVKELNADIDSSGYATGLFIFNLDGNTQPFSNLVADLKEIPGTATGSAFSAPVFEHQVYISGDRSFVSSFNFRCINVVDDNAIPPPSPLSTFYTKVEVDGLLSSKADKTGTSDIEITDYTKGIILRDSGGGRWRFGITTAGAITTTSL